VATASNSQATAKIAHLGDVPSVAHCYAALAGLENSATR
jgi:hypothetical protein